jgi:hypothetical protein
MAETEQKETDIHVCILRTGLCSFFCFPILRINQFSRSCRCGCDHMLAGFTATCAISVSLNPAHGEVYLIQHDLISL